MAHAHEHAHPAAAPSSIVATTEGVQLTASAVERIKEAMQKENLGADFGVRFAVTGGGCSGLSYSMSFERDARDDDRVLEFDGVRVFVDEASAPYLAGTTVDYVVGLHKEGFKFLNPKASRTCGCGESFAV
jgi:iron-sulfur cluster assembly protein